METLSGRETGNFQSFGKKFPHCRLFPQDGVNSCSQWVRQDMEGGRQQGPVHQSALEEMPLTGQMC